MLEANGVIYERQEAEEVLLDRFFQSKGEAAAKKEEDHMPGTEAGVPVIEQGVHSVLSRKLEMPRSVLFVVQSG